MMLRWRHMESLISDQGIYNITAASLEKNTAGCELSVLPFAVAQFEIRENLKPG